MKNRIRILATSDLHGSIYPYSYADGSETAQGMARLSTLIQSLRDDNTLLIDNGDTLQGTPLTYFHYRYHHDWICPMTTVMNLMGYDYVNIGNHDFDYGEQALQKILETLTQNKVEYNLDRPPVMEGRMMSILISPRSSKGGKPASAPKQAPKKSEGASAVTETTAEKPNI